MFTSIIKLIAIFLVIAVPVITNAGKAPPRSSWYIYDSEGWEGSWHRYGTTGTMWDYTTVAFEGTFRKNGESTRQAELGIHISEEGAIFVIRNDYGSDNQNPVRTCTYQGQIAPASMMHLEQSYKHRLKLSGTFFCSDMDKIGTWNGYMD